jgi:hypothetical protein
MKSLEFITELPNYANQYIEVCLNHTKEVATGSGKIVEQRERHIPTIAFFLNIWMPRNVGDTISRETYYEWLKCDNKAKSDTIKRVDELFQSLAADIVANEGKGIFYAKNKLGWTDKMDSTLNLPIKILNLDPLDDSKDNLLIEDSSFKETD